MKIGILKEGKVPVDHRVPFTPAQCKEITDKFPSTEIVITPSEIRCYKDEEYEKQGIKIQKDLSDCDVLMGVKEVNIAELIADKTYFFFSHTIKKQPYNKGLLQAVLAKNIRLVDYETLKLQNGQRVVAFGRFAGIVGAYNAFLTYGQKTNAYDLKPANECYDMVEMWQELKKVKLPPIKIAVTGTGRVAQGALEILKELSLPRLTLEELKVKEVKIASYAVLDSDDYNQRKDGKNFNFDDFHQNATAYEGVFRQYLPHIDILIAGAYWDPKAPVLFDETDVAKGSFQPTVIADITCDIKGSIPTTIRPSTIADPVYDIDKQTVSEQPAYSKITLSVMAVDNLPCEVSRDASESFGEQLIANVLPSLLNNETDLITTSSITTTEGKLSIYFDYLSDYIT